MKRLLLISTLSLFINMAKINARDGDCAVCGEYYISGVREIASGFRIKADSTFEFIFIYGALDRYGSGNWKSIRLSDGREALLLESAAMPGPPIRLEKFESRPPLISNYIHVKSANSALLSNMAVLMVNGPDSLVSNTDDDGALEVERKKYDKFQIALSFCPDHLVDIPQDDAKNYYEFSLEPWIFEVYFRKFILIPEGNNLLGQHPILDGSFSYEKQ